MPGYTGWIPPLDLNQWPAEWLTPFSAAVSIVPAPSSPLLYQLS